MKGAGLNRIIMTVLCLLLVHTTMLGQEEREYIRKGNRLYKKSEFAGSEGMYRRAQSQDRSTYDSGFNLGDALYKQGRFGEAADEFKKTASGTDDSLKQAQSFHNLGNSLLKDQKFDESIEAYINSLKLDPENKETKYNLAYAQDQLKKQEEQQKQQQQQKDQQQDQQKDKNKQDENKDDQKQKDDQQQNQQEQNDQNDQQQKQGQDQQQQSISREDAKRLLDALSANEKNTQEKVQRDKAARAKVRVIKNW